MKQPKCACVHPDAHECARRRDFRFIEDREEWPEEPCECACHMKDEDGFDEWDDEQ